ncbi:putative MFS family arabinose efflux permease [Saccharothrix tamanrassetensis]|uniref:Putative MFS family arabinose efflux permease n=1 Tax=Saccharothrix tamanrassetensis TaxID=1051531 RepID=A0A841CP50_9PSEU|nr:MFS transporter [Saccharothrix tamanrassetensis]MBB5957918.1 putative MFS family arabinose efflux permease [Saccharothrix tamanrassetensis]
MPAVTARTYALATGTVAAGTSGYVVAAVLGGIAARFDVSIAVAGQVITVFALAYAVGSPLLAVATAGVERRLLLVAALLVTALGNLGSAGASDFGLLLATRVVTACGAALTTPAATAVAASLHPPGTRARAMAVVTGGLTAATMLGVPAGRAVAEWGGYRAAFVLTAALCVVAAVVVRVAIPVVEPGPAAGLRQRVEALADPPVRWLLAVSLLACLATFSVYGYLDPLLAAGSAPWLLLAYGVGAVVGNLLGGCAADRYGPRGPLLVALGGCAAVLALLVAALASPVGAVAAMAAWGVLFWTFNPPLMALLVEVRPERAGVLLALNASAIYLGIAGAGVLGGAVAGGVSVRFVPLVGALLTVCALLVAAGAPAPVKDPRQPA